MHPIKGVQFYSGFANVFRVALRPAAFHTHRMGPKPRFGRTSEAGTWGGVDQQLTRPYTRTEQLDNRNWKDPYHAWTKEIAFYFGDDGERNSRR